MSVLLLLACGSGAPSTDTGGVVVRNRPPVVERLTIAPDDPRPTDALVATARVRDDDGDAVEVGFTWSSDGVVLGEGPVLQGVPLAEGQVVAVTAQASDGWSLGPPSTADIRIGNTPPVVGAVTVEPPRARAGEPLTCVATDVVDADGDPVTLAVRWTSNGDPTGDAADTLVGPTRGDEVRCHVTPSDGQDVGREVSSGAAVMQNTRPSVLEAHIVPAVPEPGDDLTVETVGWFDADGDPEGYRYQWTVDGELRGSASRIEGVLVKTAQVIGVAVTPDDGFAIGLAVEAEPVVVGGGRPSAPTLVGRPGIGAIAGRGDLVCELDRPSVDPDDDEVTYTFRWFVDDVLHSELVDAERLVAPAEDQSPGQAWRCEATPNDGTQDGDVASIALDLSPLAELWAIHDTARVRRAIIDRPDKLDNAVFDGGGIELVAGRGEVVAFQVIAETVDGLALDATLSDLEHTETGEVLAYRRPAADPTRTARRPSAVFVQHHLDVERPTDAADWVDPRTPSQPVAGTWPDPLVPSTAPVGGLPMDVGAGVAQGVWVELWVGPDRTPGRWDGAITITAGGVDSEIPIALDVVDVLLPDPLPLTVAALLDVDGVVARHGADLSDAYHRLAHRHRIVLVTPTDPDGVDAMGPRLDGGLYLPDEGYGGPGEGLGEVLVPRAWGSMPDPYADPVTAVDDAAAWAEALGAWGDPPTVLWAFDRPDPEEVADVVALGEALDGAGATLPLLVGAAPVVDAAHAVDGWIVSPSAWRTDDAAAERAAGRSYRYRDGQRPYTGAILLDTPAVDVRMHGALAFAAGVDLLPLPHATDWGDRDVWVDPVTWTDGESVANGAGVLIWPGEDLLWPGSDRGLAAPIGSIRLALLRRAAQDHALLTMARDAGLTAEVDETLALLLPAALDGVAPGDPVGFLDDAEVWERRRQTILETLAE